MGTGIVDEGSRADFWRGVIADFAGSGLTVRAYCRQRGVSQAAFYRWRSCLTAATSGREGEGFVDLGLLSGPSSGGRLEIRLDLGGGLTLQVVRS